MIDVISDMCNNNMFWFLFLKGLFFSGGDNFYNYFVG